jgi:hypothetical protein
MSQWPPRYPTNAGGVVHRMTPRIHRILSLLDDSDGYRLLRSSHLHEFLKYYFTEDCRDQTPEYTEYSEQTTARILHRLRIERKVLRVQSDPDRKTITTGSLCKIYGLNTPANKAIDERHLKTATLHGNESDTEGEKTSGKRKKKIHQNKPNYIVPHCLEIANTMAFAVVRGCRLSGGQAKFLDAPDILKSRGTAQALAAARPFTWSVPVVYKGKTYTFNLTPDRLFALYFPAWANHWFFTLEEDCSSEPQRRNDFSFSLSSSIFRKILTYVFAYAMQVPLGLYNIKGFRILFVTDSQARIRHLLEMWRLANEVLTEFQKESQIELKAVPNNVLLAIERSVLRSSDIFTAPWTNGGNNKITLDPPVAAPLLSAVG